MFTLAISGSVDQLEEGVESRTVFVTNVGQMNRYYVISFLPQNTILFGFFLQVLFLFPSVV